MLQNREDRITAVRMDAGTDFLIKPTPIAIIPNMDVITDIINVVLTTAVKVWIVKLDSMKEK
ncbi:hypothetical protein D3C73_1584790 [compost metagenome]